MAPTIPASRGTHRSPRMSVLTVVALVLDALFVVSLAGLMLAASVFGQTGGETLSDNLVLSGFGIGAGAAVLAGGVVALVAVVRGIRDHLLAVPLVIGGIALIFLLGEFLAPH